VVQLSLDADGNIWVGSSSGIYRYTKAQLDDYAAGKTRVLDVLPYGRDDGLPPLQCLPGLLHGSGRLSPSRILFATSRGLVASAGPSITLNTDPPPVVMEAVLLGNEPVGVASNVTVPPGTASVQFRYTALSYTAPGKVAFRYRLEGLDSDWSEVTTVRSARYPKIPPGRYSFHVVARNSDGIWNETGARLGLVVTPFWWETRWFRYGVPALGAAIIISLHRQRRRRLREIERLRIKIASDLHDDVGSSLWSINLLSRMLGQHGRLQPDEKHDVAEINRIAIQTSNSIRDIIWLINPGFDSMQDMLARVKDSAATTLGGISLKVETDGMDMAVRLPSSIRQNLFLLFKEALTNVGKHARASEVHFKISETTLDWTFDLSDNGVGFDSSSAYDGNGLRNMRRRAEDIGGQLSVLTSTGKGSRIIVTVRKPRPNALWRLVRRGKRKEPGEGLRA
jgi:signal transduction histidine kinase